MPTKKPKKSTPLTDRELEVARLLYFDGLTDRAMAKTLYLSEATIKTHIKNIRYKLGIEGQPSHRVELTKALAKVFNDKKEVDTAEFMERVNQHDEKTLVGFNYFLYTEIRRMRFDKDALIALSVDLYKHIQLNLEKSKDNATLQR